jgi:hypothetical protein
MSDLKLEATNNAGETTTLVAVLHDRGPDRLMDFVGDVILEVKPTRGLLVAPKAGGLPVTPDPNKNDFGGIRCAGVGAGAGLRAESQSGRGVWGVGNVGVLGAGSGHNAIGVHGTNAGSGPGVRGEGSPGVMGSSAVSSGVQGEGTPGVLGSCSANPIAVLPTVHPEPGHFAGVKGNSAHGSGVFGTGVYGGQFQGSRAQLSLVPGTSVGKPTTGPHSLGEIYMDSAASLFVCVASGTPGTWVKVVTA